MARAKHWRSPGGLGEGSFFLPLVVWRLKMVRKLGERRGKCVHTLFPANTFCGRMSAPKVILERHTITHHSTGGIAVRRIKLQPLTANRLRPIRSVVLLGFWIQERNGRGPVRIIKKP